MDRSEQIFFGAEKQYQDALIVKVPSGLGSKVELLDFLGKKLSFPNYFGGNWDAFEECLADLSWLGKSAVVISHADLPLADGSEDQKTYLAILKKLSAEPLEVQIYSAFPAGYAGAIKDLIGLQDTH